ncbi:YdgA family protein [Pasteurellaceae bacterium 22721_9_1]
MKKSTIALAVVAILGSVWAGGAWYTGQKAEAEYQRQIEVANTKLKQQTLTKDVDGMNFYAQIENVKFERGFFSSDYRYDWVMKINDMDFNLPLEGKFYHGPIPLNHLTQFNLMPVMFSVTGQLVNNEQTRAIFEATKGKSPFFSQAAVSYDLQTKGYVDINSGNMKSSGVEANWDNGKIKFDVDKNGLGKSEMEMPKADLLLSINDPRLATIKITIDDLKAHSDVKSTQFSTLFDGFVKANIGQIQYDYTYHENVPEKSRVQNSVFKNIALDYNSKLNNDFIDNGIKLDFEFFANEQALGKFKLNAEVNHLLASATDEIQKISADNEAEYQRLGLEVLQNEPHLKIDELSVTNEKGKIEADLNINVAKVDLAKVNSAPLSLFKELALHAKADKQAISHLLNQLIQVGKANMDKAKYEKNIELAVDSWIDEAKQQGILIEKEGKLTLNIEAQKEGLNFNGYVISEQDLKFFLLGVLMKFAH